jgi:glycosyltransferase involved in cell wall biosynthesis
VVPDLPERLRIAFLAYRGNPHSGGQGVYTRRLTAELVALGHEPVVFGGPPYPELEPGVRLVRLPSLDLYREPDPFRIPRPSEIRGLADLVEVGIMCTGGFPEPLTFSWRARRALLGLRDRFDLVHDNQCLASGLLGIMADGWPLLGTIHHPITVDRSLELAHATSLRRRFGVWRWYGFVRMQRRVARRLPLVVTVSAASADDIVAQMGVERDRIGVVPVGVDHEVFRPVPGVARKPGRVMTTASADVALKGLVPLLEAIALVRRRRPDVELVVVGKLRDGSPTAGVLRRLGLADVVRFVADVPEEALVRLYSEASVAVVPSLYEGFSLPAIEAMACGTPLVATTGGALPEVAGDDGRAALLAPPGDPGELAERIVLVLDHPELAGRLGEAGRRRVLERFTWRATAEGTVALYRRVLEDARLAQVSPRQATRPLPGDPGEGDKGLDRAATA